MSLEKAKKYLEEKCFKNPDKIVELAEPIIAEAMKQSTTAEIHGVFRPISIAVRNYRNYKEERFDFVSDILIRYKNIKKIYGYKMDSYWSNIACVDSYYKTNMDFLKPEIRNYFFKQEPTIKTKIDDLPPAKYNPGAQVKNSLVASGCIINGTVENSVLFKDVFVGNNCVIKNSVILNNVYLGDNTHIENCIVESRDTIRANSYYCGDGEVKIVVEKNERYVL